MEQVYVSGALTNNARKDFYEKIRDIILNCGMKAYIPYLHIEPKNNSIETSEEIYEVDMTKIEESSYMVAYVGLPSLGVGVELEHANACGIPIIIMYKEDEVVSKLVCGIPSVCKIIKYSDEEYGLYELMKELISKVFCNDNAF